MAICASAYTLADSTVVIALDTSNLNLSTCQMVVMSGADFDNSLLNLTPEQAVTVSGVVCLIWATAWIFKQIVKAINSKMETGNEPE